MTFERSFILALKVNAAFIATLLIYAGGRKCYSAYLQHRYSSNPPAYSYDDFGKALNFAMYTTNMRQSKNVKAYYDSVKVGLHPAISFDINCLPVDVPVKVIGYIGSDSGVVEFIQVKECCWGYIHGYASASTMHRSLPKDTLLKLYRASAAKYLEEHPTPHYGGTLSEYGFYCNCD